MQSEVELLRAELNRLRSIVEKDLKNRNSVAAQASQAPVTDDLQEHVVVANLTGNAVRVAISVELAADFTDILSIKQHDYVMAARARRAMRSTG